MNEVFTEVLEPRGHARKSTNKGKQWQRISPVPEEDDEWLLVGTQ